MENQIVEKRRMVKEGDYTLYLGGKRFETLRKLLQEDEELMARLAKEETRDNQTEERSSDSVR